MTDLDLPALQWMRTLEPVYSDSKYFRTSTTAGKMLNPGTSLIARFLYSMRSSNALSTLWLIELMIFVTPCDSNRGRFFAAFELVYYFAYHERNISGGPLNTLFKRSNGSWSLCWPVISAE